MLFSSFNCIISSFIVVSISNVYSSYYAPDQDLAGYPANFFAGYPAKKNTKKNFYLNLEFYILILFVAQLFYFLLVEIVSPAGYPADGTGYPAGYRISKKAGYPVQP